MDEELKCRPELGNHNWDLKKKTCACGELGGEGYDTALTQAFFDASGEIDLEDAVIEAAVKWREWHIQRALIYVPLVVTELGAAVDALIAARKEQK